MDGPHQRAEAGDRHYILYVQQVEGVPLLQSRELKAEPLCRVRVRHPYCFHIGAAEGVAVDGEHIRVVEKEIELVLRRHLKSPGEELDKVCPRPLENPVNDMKVYAYLQSQIQPSGSGLRARGLAVDGHVGFDEAERPLLAGGGGSGQVRFRRGEPPSKGG